MTDHQQKPVNRSMTPKTPTAVPFKKGDIIWVVYRKHINWPAKVTAYYPKERKVSYVFFPLVPKNNVFKADPAKVQLFTLDDQLPENAKPDLEECFEQARRVLQGVPEEEIIAENAQKAEETPVQAKPKKKALTTADALKKSVATPKSTPKRQPKAAILAEKAANFTQGDPIIVDTPMGMWPGMFISLAKGDSQKVNYSLFPREEHSHEVLLTTIASIIPFPPEQIEQALEDGRESNSQVLLAAMLDLQKYLKERGHSTDTTSSSSSADVSQTPLSSGSSMMLNESSVKEKKSKKPVKMELTPPKESNKAQPRKSLNSRLSNRGGDEENVTAPAAMKSKKRAASQMLQEEEEEAVNDEPPAEPMVKRRKELGMETDDETANEEEEEEEEEEDAKALSLSPPTTAAATASHKNSPIHQLMMNGEGGSAAEGKPRRLSEAERNQELAHLGEKVEKVMREKQQKAMKDRDQQQQQQTTSSSSLSPSPAKESAMAKKVAADAAIPTVSVTESANKGVSAYEVAVSNECQTHIEGVLSKFGEEWFLAQLESDENFCLEFQKVGMFTRKELADLVSVVQKWVESVFYEESCPDERFSQLCELSLISKHVMPEIGAFVIATQNDCSLEEAKRIYAEKCASALVSADPPTASPKQQQVHKQNNNTTTNNKSISTLIEAAKMMEGGASSEEQHQNGVSVPNSPGESSSAMPLVTNNNNSLTIQADTDSAGDSE